MHWMGVLSHPTCPFGKTFFQPAGAGRKFPGCLLGLGLCRDQRGRAGFGGIAAAIFARQLHRVITAAQQQVADNRLPQRLADAAGEIIADSRALRRGLHERHGRIERLFQHHRACGCWRGRRRCTITTVAGANHRLDGNQIVDSTAVRLRPRTPDQLVALGQALLLLGVEPKLVLENCFQQRRKTGPAAARGVYSPPASLRWTSMISHWPPTLSARA